MNAPGTIVTTSERKSSLPRFNDELARASARIGSVHLHWDRASTIATLWLANASELHLSVPLESLSPKVGETVEVRTRIGLNDFQCTVAVERLTEVYGSFKLMCCRLNSNAETGSLDVQRRANSRFTFSPRIRCSALHGIRSTVARCPCAPLTFRTGVSRWLVPHRKTFHFWD